MAYYKTEVDKKGNELRYKVWYDTFTDDDTGEDIKVKRHRLVKVNGDRVRFYSNSEMKQMSRQQREAIKLRLK